MQDKATLIDQLRIDRSAGPAPTRSRWPWLVGIAAVVVAIGVGGWFTLAGASGVPIKAASARAVPGEGSAAGGSLLDASGYVVARRKATVSSKIQGRVVEVLVDEGQRIEKDQVVGRLDDSNIRISVAQATAQLRQQEASVASATAAFENIKPLFERNKALFGKGHISSTAYETAKSNYDAAQNSLAVSKATADVSRAALKSAEQNLADTTLRAPFAGVVIAKNAQPGEMISPGATGGSTRTGICTIVDMDSLVVEVDVSENFISRVHSGQPATIRLNAYPDWQIPGAILAVIPTADRAKATVQVRVGFKEKDERVIPDMGARVSFLEDAPPPSAQAKPRPVGVIVPTEAVQGTGDNAAVYVITKNTVQKRTVRLGARNSDGQTVLSGLSAGEQVAVGDLTQLTDGTKVLIQ